MVVRRGGHAMGSGRLPAGAPGEWAETAETLDTDTIPGLDASNTQAGA
jgi:hypothetical protein